MSTEYVPNREGIAALAMDAQMASVMMTYGKQAQAYAESIAPRGSGPYDKHIGRYAHSFQVVPTVVTRAGMSRAASMLINTAPYAHGVEWRNGQHILARTASWLDGKSRVVATSTSGTRWRASHVGQKAARASQRRRRRPSSGG